MSGAQARAFRGGGLRGALRRSPVVVAALAFAGGLGLFLSGVTLVRAADDVGILAWFQNEHVDRIARAVRFRERPGTQDVAQRPAPSRTVVEPATLERQAVTRPIERRAAARRPVERKARVRLAANGARVASVAPTPAATRQTLCVRTCDGYAFPVGSLMSLRDLPIHESACEAACPSAETALYTIPAGVRSDGAAQARSVANGTPYRHLPNAFLHRKVAVPNCSCQGDQPGSKTLSILLDPTLRSGDVVVDRKGEAKVYAGPGRAPHSPRAFADFRRSPALPRTAQRQVDRVMGASQRETAARDFERTLRIRQASLREAAAPAGSGAGVRMYQVTADSGRTHASGARIVVVR